MNYFKTLGKSILSMISILLIVTLLITILNYFNIVGHKLTAIFKIIIALISMFAGGFIIGQNSKQKGWLEGLKLGLIIVVILLLFNYFVLKHSWNIKHLVYYLILLSSTMFGGMIGISKNSETKE